MKISPGAKNAFLLGIVVATTQTTTHTDAFQTTPTSSSHPLLLSEFQVVASSSASGATSTTPATSSPLFAVSPEQEIQALEEAAKYAPAKVAGSTSPAASVDNGFASAMTAYMAKSHEEKLQKQQQLKERDEEIVALKEQLQEATELVDAYHKSLTEVIVRYELQLEGKGDVSVSPAANDGASTTGGANINTTWKTGSFATVVRPGSSPTPASKPVFSTGTEATATVAPTTSAAPVPVTAAPVTAVAPSVPTTTSLYEQRNEFIKKAAAAGKSRWGNEEIVKLGGPKQPVEIMPGGAPVVAKSAPPTGQVLASGVASSISSAQPVGPDGGAMMTVGTSPPASASNLGASIVANANAAAAAPSAPQAEVIAEADHGWFRAGMKSLADRVTMGSKTPAPVVEEEASVTAATTAGTATAYEQRNDLIQKAAAAGKSRWGDAEILKVGGTAQPVILNAGETAASAAPSDELIAEADHGWYRDGMTSLSDRVNLGAAAVVAAAAASSSSSTSTSAYEQRNELIKNAAAAGKSRWGDAEIVKLGGAAQPLVLNAGETVASPAPTVELIAEADHGWFRDGMTSLSDRVNLGAAAVVAASANAAVATASHDTSLYDQRNAKIAEMASAGKSRWGTAEVSKVQKLATASVPSAGINGAPATAAAAAPVSLQNRVNLGVAAVTGVPATSAPATATPATTTNIGAAALNAVEPLKVTESVPEVASVVKSAPSKPSAIQGGGNFFSDSIAYGSGWGN